jgi:hypothetical protein
VFKRNKRNKRLWVRSEEVDDEDEDDGATQCGIEKTKTTCVSGEALLQRPRVLDAALVNNTQAERREDD